MFPGTGEHFEVTSEDQPTLTAFLLRRARQRAGLSLAQVAERLGATSINAYARYQQGRSSPDHPETLGAFRGCHAAPGPGPGRERDVMVEAAEPFVAAAGRHTRIGALRNFSARREKGAAPFSRSVPNCFKISGEILSIWQRINSD
ncbi:helix-turn-helix domain-containing protein [Candidatus Methylomirabilis limnetica]|uniref:helix-turn-helix domain-containing protein n=1 Tax=Candidatus Methylomirabilis limnetica TaxID=2033718 RepID=UPI001379C95D